jgi:hypothetical protein
MPTSKNFDGCFSPNFTSPVPSAIAAVIAMMRSFSEASRDSASANTLQ